MSNESFIGMTINKYKIIKYINSGAFGNVYHVIHKKTNESYALKIPIISEEKDGRKMIIDEGKIYKHLSNPSKGIPNVKLIQYENKKLMVMDLLGQSLESLMQKHKKFSLQTILKLAISIMDILQHIHYNGYIHRDLKPDNFTIGDKFKNNIYCIDFGLAKKYINKVGNHIPFSENRKFCGTAKYASIAAHERCEQSRKDDLESIAYMFVYFFNGKLPWSNIRTKDKKKRYKLIHEQKLKYSSTELCKGMPREFIVFMDYVKTLNFDETPPYKSFKKMFSRLYDKSGYTDNLYDWER